MKPRRLPNTAFPGILGTRTSLVPLFSSQAPVCFSKMEAKVLARSVTTPSEGAVGIPPALTTPRSREGEHKPSLSTDAGREQVLPCFLTTISSAESREDAPMSQVTASSAWVCAYRRAAWSSSSSPRHLSSSACVFQVTQKHPPHVHTQAASGISRTPESTSGQPWSASA